MGKVSSLFEVYKIEPLEPKSKNLVLKTKMQVFRKREDAIEWLEENGNENVDYTILEILSFKKI